MFDIEVFTPNFSAVNTTLPLGNIRFGLTLFISEIRDICGWR